MKSAFRKLCCHLLGHRYDISLLEYVNGTLRCTEERCFRCKRVRPDPYYKIMADYGDTYCDFWGKVQ